MSSGEAPVPEVRLLLSLGSAREEREHLSQLRQLVHRAPGPRVLLCRSGLSAAPSETADTSSLLHFQLV